MSSATASPLLICHIPKTAGSSLRKLVARLNPDTTFVYERELRLGNPDIDFVARFRAAPKPAVVMGHFGYTAHRLLGVPPAYVTILREPVARIVSLYRHQRSLPDSAFAAQFAAGMSLEEFVTSEITEMTNNHMCRVIAGIAPESGLALHERWLLDLALHNLRRDFVLTGTTERFGEFLTELGGLLDWGPFEVPLDNVTPGPEVELDARTRAEIVARNALDLELYEHVRRRDAVSR